MYPLALIVIISGQIKNQNSNLIFWVNGFQNNSLSPICHGLLQKIDNGLIKAYEVFGNKLDKILNELNEVLVA